MVGDNVNGKQIDCVLELARTLNFNRAAENLFLSQPSITYHVKSLEDEVGFKIFTRTPQGASLTPAGEQFCNALRNIRADLKFAIEQGQNIGNRYQANISIGLPTRSAIKFLPQAIEKFEKKFAGISVTPELIPLDNYEKFLRGGQDLVFAREEDLRHVSTVKIHKLFQSKIYLIVEVTDKLAKREKIFMDDLKNRTLMVGGGSQPELRKVQKRVIQNLNLPHFNSNDYDTTLINIAAHKGICLAPGFLNDHSGNFAWIPFDCAESISCVICSHLNDKRAYVQDFVAILQNFYATNPDFLG